MSTKNNPGPVDCYAAAEPDEPMFILLARDPRAAVLVNLWATMRSLAGDDTTGKAVTAFALADDMVAWLKQNRQADPAGMSTAAQGLAALAEIVGAVVTIGQEPDDPQAIHHVVTVRSKRPPTPVAV